MTNAPPVVTCSCGREIVVLPGVRAWHCSRCGGHAAGALPARKGQLCGRCIPVEQRGRPKSEAAA